MQMSAIWKLKACLKAHLRLSVEAEVFIRRERGTEQRDQGGVAKFCTHSRAQSIPIRQVLVQCASSWFSHPGFLSSWLYVILAPRLKVSKSPGDGLPKDWSLYPF